MVFETKKNEIFKEQLNGNTLAKQAIAMPVNINPL